jgi:hypothetical protein
MTLAPYLREVVPSPPSTQLLRFWVPPRNHKVQTKAFDSEDPSSQLSARMSCVAHRTSCNRCNKVRVTDVSRRLDHSGRLTRCRLHDRRVAFHGEFHPSTGFSMSALRIGHAACRRSQLTTGPLECIANYCCDALQPLQLSSAVPSLASCR